MKTRRPERFSDSSIDSDRPLDRSLLEYHLDTITNRGEEARFANFARSVAERAVCPNLLPQTGPTGGGDSKVDSETFPVADAIAVLWTGSARDAANERWAFAFSAKKEWRGKAISDTEKAVATDRGYSKVFFISNQFIPDKARADLEDKLRTAHNVDVRLLDRTWLLDRVFELGLQQLAIEGLGISVTHNPKLRIGPLDLQKTEQLGALSREIEAAVRESRWTPALVDDCRQAARLARELERPRAEVDGLFARALEYSKRAGTAMQQFFIKYESAWTAYWWHEDAALAEKIYQDLEAAALETDNVYQLELLTNIWIIIGVSGIRSGKPPILHQDRTNALLKSLERLEKQLDRPSSALQARTLRLHIRLQQSVRGDPSPVLKELRSVIEAAEKLAGFPLEPLVRVVEDLGDYLGGLSAYSELFEKIVEVRSRRLGELEAARLLTKCGAQHLRAKRFSEAIRFFGRGTRRLLKDESRSEAVRVLSLCAHAYEQLGLLWAARGTAAAAAALAIREYTIFGRFTRSQVLCFEQLKWLELQLGRLPQLLAWHEAARTFAVAEGGGISPEGSEIDSFDTILGVLFLNLPLGSLKYLACLAATLDRLDLGASAIALRYALGHEEPARRAFQQLPPARPAQDLPFQMAKWRDQPAREEIRSPLFLGNTPKLHLESSVCGAKIVVDADNDPACLSLGESVLGAIEAFLATGLTDRIFAREPLLEIRVRRSDFADDLFTVSSSTRDGRPFFELVCSSFDPATLGPSELEIFQRRLLEAVGKIFANGFVVAHADKAIEKLFNEDLAADRAVIFAGNPGSASQILGRRQLTSIEAWESNENPRGELLRTEPWDHHLPQKPSANVQKSTGRTETTNQETDAGSAVRHSDIRTESPIRLALWKKARWLGVGFGWGADTLPVMFVIFEREKPAVEIFSLWATETAATKKPGRLRVSIVRGVDRNAPFVYRVVIGSGLPEVSRSSENVTSIAQVNEMRPASGTNLDSFLVDYQAKGSFVLACALGRRDSNSVRPANAPIVDQPCLVVRHAWEVGRHDLEVMAIKPDDTPIRPPGLAVAPIDETLAWLRSR